MDIILKVTTIGIILKYAPINTDWWLYILIMQQIKQCYLLQLFFFQNKKVKNVLTVYLFCDFHIPI